MLITITFTDPILVLLPTDSFQSTVLKFFSSNTLISRLYDLLSGYLITLMVPNIILIITFLTVLIKEFGSPLFLNWGIRISAGPSHLPSH